MFGERNWPIIDVSRRSIEETAAAILKMIDCRKPVLFDCIVDQEENCYPMIPSGAAHNEMILCDAEETEVSDAGKMLV